MEASPRRWEAFGVAQWTRGSIRSRIYCGGGKLVYLPCPLTRMLFQHHVRQKLLLSQINVSTHGNSKRYAVLAISSSLSIRSCGRLATEETKVTTGEFDALQRLANVPRGLAHTLMLAHGFTREQIAGLVEAGLVTVVPDMAQIGEQTIEVELVMITDVGRRALR
jgi:hypothetical protein